MKLNVKAFALAGGILWGAGIFLLTWWIIGFHGATGDPTWLGKVYLGYRLDAWGSLIGLVWAFFDGLIFAALFAWLYNSFVSRFVS